MGNQATAMRLIIREKQSLGTYVTSAEYPGVPLAARVRARMTGRCNVMTPPALPGLSGVASRQ